jgi:biotin-(acetyl-CoA carboxylase) ligase
MLIEMEGDYLIVGIGCNVMTSPEVAATGVDGGRPAACIRDFNPSMEKVWNEFLLTNIQANVEVLPSNSENDYQLNPRIEEKDFHKRIIIDMVERFAEWINTRKDTKEKVIEDFTKLMDKSPQKRRDLPEGQNIVHPLRLNADGTLRVS